MSIALPDLSFLSIRKTRPCPHSRVPLTAGDIIWYYQDRDEPVPRDELNIGDIQAGKYRAFRERGSLDDIMQGPATEPVYYVNGDYTQPEQIQWYNLESLRRTLENDTQHRDPIKRIVLGPWDPRRLRPVFETTEDHVQPAISDQGLCDVAGDCISYGATERRAGRSDSHGEGDRRVRRRLDGGGEHANTEIVLPDGDIDSRTVEEIENANRAWGLRFPVIQELHAIDVLTQMVQENSENMIYINCNIRWEILLSLRQGTTFPGPSIFYEKTLPGISPHWTYERCLIESTFETVNCEVAYYEDAAEPKQEGELFRFATPHNTQAYIVGISVVDAERLSIKYWIQSIPYNHSVSVQRVVREWPPLSGIEGNRRLRSSTIDLELIYHRLGQFCRRNSYVIPNREVLQQIYVDVLQSLLNRRPLESPQEFFRMMLVNDENTRPCYQLYKEILKILVQTHRRDLRILFRGNTRFIITRLNQSKGKAYKILSDRFITSDGIPWNRYRIEDCNDTLLFML